MVIYCFQITSVSEVSLYISNNCISVYEPILATYCAVILLIDKLLEGMRGTLRLTNELCILTTRGHCCSKFFSALEATYQVFRCWLTTSDIRQ